MAMIRRLLRCRLREWLTFDSVVIAGLIRLMVFVAGFLLDRFGRVKLGFRWLSKLHVGGRPALLCRLAESRIRDRLTPRGEAPAALEPYLRSHIDTAPSRAAASLMRAPEKMLPYLAMVVDSPDAGRKGTIIVAYSYAFPLFAHFYDIDRILENYHLVLEPSWSGYGTEDVLCATLMKEPVFVQAFEPYDAGLLQRVGMNLVPVRTSSNWWVDHRVFTPDTRVEKDLDFVMVASWADFKRHHRFFSALRTLRRRGKRLTGACLGYPVDRSKAEIEAVARWYGVADQVEFVENVPQTQVAAYLRRAKLNAVWSRREGVNRAIIEGMFCDVPCLLPEGFNYGFRYPYVNDQTGRWANDATLPRTLLEMTERPWPHSPRAWVERQITPERATRLIEEAINATPGCETGSLAVKVNGLHGMEYWDRSDERRFAGDYEFLRSTIRTGAKPPVLV